MDRVTSSYLQTPPTQSQGSFGHVSIHYFHLRDLGFSQRCFEYLSHVGCDAVSLGELLTTIPRITMPWLSGWLYPEDKGTTLSLSLSRSVVNISPIGKEWHPKHLNFNCIIAFFRWFEARFGGCLSFFKIWRYIYTYLPVHVRTATFIYKILFIILFYYCYDKTTCKLRSWKNLVWEV